MKTLLLIYLIALAVMSLIAFAAYGRDKRLARKNAWRTPEKTLLLLAALLGGPGAFLGMRTFRHKTQHTRFRILVPLCMALQLALLVYLAWKAFLG